MKRSAKRRLSLVFLPVLIFSAALWLLSACERKPAQASSRPASSGKPAAGAEPAAARKFPVRTQTVAAQPVVYELETVGTLVEENLFNIPARVAGAVERLEFSEGDLATTGQELCRIDYERYRLLAERARKNAAQQLASTRKLEAQLADIERKTSASLDTARIELELAESEWRRRNTSTSGNYVSAEERMKFQAAYRRALSSLRDAEAAARTQMALALASLEEERASFEASRVSLALAEEDLKNCVVRAPIAGVIQQREVTQGQYLTAGSKIAVMVQSDPLRLRFTAPESKSAALAQDMKVRFQVPAYPAQIFEARLYSVGSLLDPATREVPCWARVDNPGGALRPGYFAKVQVQIDSRKDSIVVPLASVLPTEAGMVCYTVEDGVAVRRSVQTGIHVTGDLVEIVSGLEPGQQVIVEGAASVQDKVAVKVVNAMEGSGGEGKAGPALEGSGDGGSPRSGGGAAKASSTPAPGAAAEARKAGAAAK